MGELDLNHICTQMIDSQLASVGNGFKKHIWWLSGVFYICSQIAEWKLRGRDDSCKYDVEVKEITQPQM